MDIKLDKAGTYTIRVYAVDKHGSHTTKNFTLTLQKPKPVKKIQEEQTTEPQNTTEVPTPVQPTPQETAVQPTYVNGVLIVNKRYGIMGEMMRMPMPHCKHCKRGQGKSVIPCRYYPGIAPMITRHLCITVMYSGMDRLSLTPISQDPAFLNIKQD